MHTFRRSGKSYKKEQYKYFNKIKHPLQPANRKLLRSAFSLFSSFSNFLRSSAAHAAWTNTPCEDLRLPTREQKRDSKGVLVDAFTYFYGREPPSMSYAVLPSLPSFYFHSHSPSGHTLPQNKPKTPKSLVERAGLAATYRGGEQWCSCFICRPACRHRMPRSLSG